MTRQSRHRKRRRIRGLCEREGCPVFSGPACHCPEHAQELAERMRRRYYRQKAAA